MNNIYSFLQYGQFADVLDPMIVVGLAVGVLFVSGLMVYQSKDKNINYDDLEDDEQDVVDIIRNSDDKIRQKEISNQLDWEDTKTSRITSSLVENNVVEKVREERENYIKISQDLKKDED